MLAFHQIPLGQGEIQEEEAHTPVFAPKSRGARIVAPVIPENIPLKCRYDAEMEVWRCSYESWFKQPGVYMLGVAALAGLVAGFLFGQSREFRQAVKTVREISPL